MPPQSKVESIYSSNSAHFILEFLNFSLNNLRITFWIKRLIRTPSYFTITHGASSRRRILHWSRVTLRVAMLHGWTWVEDANLLHRPVCPEPGRGIRRRLANFTSQSNAVVKRFIRAVLQSCMSHSCLWHVRILRSENTWTSRKLLPRTETCCQYIVLRVFYIQTKILAVSVRHATTPRSVARGSVGPLYSASLSTLPPASAHPLQTRRAEYQKGPSLLNAP